MRILWVYFNVFLYILFHIIPIRRRYNHHEKYSIDERFKYMGKVCNLIVKKTGIKVIVEGREYLTDQAVLYTANHPSMIDPYFVSYAVERQLGAVIAGDLWFDRIPVIAPWLKSLGSVFVDRKNSREGIKGINQAVENVKDGHSLVIFPEGEITKFITENSVGKYNSGGLKIATKAKVPIIPVAIIGTDKSYSAHEVIGKLTKGTVVIKILPPYVKHLTDDVSVYTVAEEIQVLTETAVMNTIIKDINY